MTLLLFLVYQAGYCQLKPLNKKELKQLIKEGIKARKEEYKDSWVICNKDSSYFKSDTLILHGNIYNTRHLKDCCIYIGWEFTNKRKMAQTSIDSCNPPVIVGKVLTEKDFYKIKLSKKNNKLLLKRYNGSKLIDTYEVLGCTETQNENHKNPVITLVRQ